MGNLKKFLALSLAMLMVTGVMTSVMAKPFDDIESDYDFAEQIDVLSDIGVIRGTSNTEFSPEDDVTREQMAMFLFRLMLGKDNAGTTNGTNFEDLYDEVYHGAISWATAAGFIIGTSGTTFEPVGGISLQDGMTMIIRALGQSTSQMDKGYPWTYIDKGIKLGLENNLEDVDYEDTLSRGELSCLLYNALTAEYLIPKGSNNNSTYFEKTSIIEYVFNYEMEVATLVATNDHSIGDKNIVVKNDYVTFTYTDVIGDKNITKTLTVKFDELGLDGEANDWLGRKIKLLFKVDAQTRLVSVLGSIDLGKSESYDVVTVGDKQKYIEVDGVKYNVVETLSDALGTNANELQVYSYDKTGHLTQLKNNAQVDEKLGYYVMTMIYDNKDSDTADRAILKNYKFNQFKITNDKVNIAGDLKLTDLEGGIINNVEAKPGDYVLYYFNEELKSLEIIQKIAVQDRQLVTKLSATTATVGGVEYKLGNPKAGVSVESIRNNLISGQNAQIVEKGGYILAVANASVITDTTSKYLVATSNATPVYVNGSLSYVITANVDGVNTNVFVNTPNVNVGQMYRYNKDGNDVYTIIAPVITNSLIESGYDKFVQANEIATIIDSANGTIIGTNNTPYYTLDNGSATGNTSLSNSWNDINFVTDKDTVIVIKNGSNYQVKKGTYGSSILVRDGAKVTATFINEAGSIETLRYLYVSDGELGLIDVSSHYAKVLANVGNEYINNKVYTIYEVFNFVTGEKETKKSLINNLAVGKTYAIDVLGELSNTLVDTTNGLVTGYTNATITINGTTHKLANNFKVKTINPDLTLTEKKLSDIYMTNVELLVIGGEVRSIITGTQIQYTTTYKAPVTTEQAENAKVIVTTTSNLTGIDTGNVKFITLTNNNIPVNAPNVTLTVSGTNNEIITFDMSDTTMTAGNYTITFSVGGVNYNGTFIIA